MRYSISRGANPGTDSQFPANCAGNLVSVPGLRGTIAPGGRRQNAAFACRYAQSSHGISDSILEVSTVAPPHILIPGGASRYDPMSYATPSASSMDPMDLACLACASTGSAR